MNGIYTHSRADRHNTDHTVNLLYNNDSGWIMALVAIEQEEESSDEDNYDPWNREEKCDWEWVFIDTKTRDRFSHKGDTIIPGAGVRWKHLHRGKEGEDENKKEEEKDHNEDKLAAGAAASSDSGEEDEKDKQMTEANEDDENELPWQVCLQYKRQVSNQEIVQVIALLDQSVLKDLKNSQAYREKRVVSNVVVFSFDVFC